MVAPAAAPDHQPRDLAPKQTTVLTKIRLARRIFLSRDQQIEASRTTPAVTLGVTDRVWTIGDLIDAALAIVPEELGRRRKPRNFTVIKGGKE